MADPQTEVLPRRHESKLLRCDWYPDVPDHRDYLASSPRITAALSRLPRSRTAGDPPGFVDAREYGSLSIHSSGQVPSSVEAVAALIEHFERRASGRSLELSRGFLTYAAQRYAAAAGGTVTLRTVLKAARQCGFTEEKYFSTPNSAAAPDALTFHLAHSLKRMRYFRLDGPDATGEVILRRLRAYLTAGFPTAFGFAVSNSDDADPHIWCPTTMDDNFGGTAAIAVGFGDRLRIRSDKGALLIRGNWRPRQQAPEYGWLPYSFVRRRLALDFWTVLTRAWLRSSEFTAPARA